MVIDANSPKARCPMMNGLVCMGPACALWRALDGVKGYCGAGGAVPMATEVVAADGEKPLRNPRRTGRGSAPVTRG